MVADMKPFIFLYGPPGVGKSATGKTLGNSLKMPFIDMDEQIEAYAGRTIPEIFDLEGESHFREMEKLTLEETLKGETCVVALGGGALLDQSSRDLVEAHGQLVCLLASPEILMARLEYDELERPLLQASTLTNLLEERREHYASFPLHLNTNELSAGQAAWEIQIRLGLFHISGMGPGYKVFVKPGILNHLGELSAPENSNTPIALVSDENVGAIYGDVAMKSLDGFSKKANMIIIPPGETHKTIDTVSQLWSHFLDLGMERKSLVAALGGGVINDLAGFAAATFMRGIPWIGIPSSLLAMVDASLGGKTGANLPAGKNLVGAFHPPLLVVVDPDMLSTLPKDEIICGLAEVIKHAIISDPELFSICAQGLDSIQDNWPYLLSRAIAVKAQVIQEDPYEGGKREVLNFGHTIGHAVESLSGYCIRHGEAVAIGMVAEAHLAELLEISNCGLADHLREVLSILGLPTQIPADIDHKKLIRKMDADKKRVGGHTRFALPKKVGEVHPSIKVQDLGNLISHL
jgi:3-dehydroquinate synthase